MSFAFGRQGLSLVCELATPSAYVCAAAAATAALTISNSANCAAYDAFSSGTSVSSPRNETDISDSALYAKTYPSELKSVWTVYSPYNLAFTALRSLLFNLLPVWQEYFQAVEAAEEEAFARGLEPLEEWPPWPHEQVRPALQRSVFMAIRDLCTLTVRRLFEKEASQRCSPRTTSKLLKDWKASIIRKNSLPVYYRVPRIVRTYFRANVLGAAADCAVSICIDSYRVILRPVHQRQRQRPPKLIVRRFARICAANVFRCSTSLVVASVGAGVGAGVFSLIPFSRPSTPALGAFVGATASEFSYTVFLVAPLVNAWAYGDDPEPLPPADPAGGGNGDVQLHNDDGLQPAM